MSIKFGITNQFKYTGSLQIKVWEISTNHEPRKHFQLWETTELDLVFH